MQSHFIFCCLLHAQFSANKNIRIGLTITLAYILSYSISKFNSEIYTIFLYISIYFPQQNYCRAKYSNRLLFRKFQLSDFGLKINAAKTEKITSAAIPAAPAVNPPVSTPKKPSSESAFFTPLHKVYPKPV